MTADRTALFVRVPTALAAELDARARSAGRSKQGLVTELLEGGTAASPLTGETGEVLDLAEVAELLRLGEDDVIERIASSDFPGRRFGSTWRFSRAAVLSWLAGSDPVTARPTGFSSRAD